MVKKEVNWGMDITKGKKDRRDATITGRIPKRYKEMIEKNNICAGKLIMRACEQLDNSLKEA